MKSADEYFQEVVQAMGGQVEDGGISRSYHWDTPQEGRFLIESLTHVQKELRLIRKSINNDLTAIRNHYKARRGGVEAGLLTTLLSRKLAGRERADKKRALSRDEQSAILPYTKVKQTIDNALLEFDRVKTQIELDITTRPK